MLADLGVAESVLYLLVVRLTVIRGCHGNYQILTAGGSYHSTPGGGSPHSSGTTPGMMGMFTY